MRFPEFIIIGAAKAGTTTLFEYLFKHPQIFMPERKEVSFFSVDEIYARGIDWYASNFNEAGPEQICGEASTKYSRLEQHPKTLERMAPILPKVKLIYIMRHPVDRAYSFYVHRKKGARIKPHLAVPNTFEEAIQENSEFLDSSNYIRQINTYLEFYPRESFLFFLMEDLIQDPINVTQKIFNFIGVDDSVDVVSSNNIVANKASDHPEWYVKDQLLKPFKSLPFFSKISQTIPNRFREDIYNLVKKFTYNNWANSQDTPIPMRPETRVTLLEHFEQPNRELEAFLGRDLSHWST